MLTKEQLLASPPEDYMNDEQLAYFRQLLEKERKEILEGLESTTRHLRDDNSREPDEHDRATLEEEYQLELRIRERETRLLRKIDQALRRIETGEYGYCEVTGEPIGIPRLLARPTATLSIEAKERAEVEERTRRS
ncbi:RNA polymerase-binding protein DksA [Alkalilimnicola ehrlichii MLHE-1]|nr:RNA polymerase-binding protein DksA [Alkalilimnicola ehrlichii]